MITRKVAKAHGLRTLWRMSGTRTSRLRRDGPSRWIDGGGEGRGWSVVRVPIAVHAADAQMSDG